jgi:hypothetical protein
MEMAPDTVVIFSKSGLFSSLLGNSSIHEIFKYVYSKNLILTSAEMVGDVYVGFVMSSKCIYVQQMHIYFSCVIDLLCCVALCGCCAG